MDWSFLNDILLFIEDVLISISVWMRPYLSHIGIAIAATLLAIFGNEIIAQLKKQIGALSLFLRITLFIVFCAFGFAFIMSFLTPLFVNFLASISDTWLALVVVGLFYSVGFIAQRKGMI